jgi:hypothetical protein
LGMLFQLASKYPPALGGKVKSEDRQWMIYSTF